MRFQRNRNILTIQEQDKLWNSCVVIVGCGGGGGTLAELLVRTGVGTLILIDGDTYEESNLNRQIGSTVKTLGRYKVEVLKERFLEINPYVKVRIFPEYLTMDNYKSILNPLFEEFDSISISDTADGYKNKKLIDNICKELNVPHITGGVGFYMGWTAKIVNSEIDDYLPDDGSRVVYPAPSMVWMQASLQSQLVINLLLDRDWGVDDKRIFINMMTSMIEVSEES